MRGHQLKSRKVLFIVLLLVSLNGVASTQDEINHLLSAVVSTNCQYERNGTFYNGKDAIKHINKKYAYYADDIKSAEDFIKYSATKSKMSGNDYKIHCSNSAPVKSQEWLLKALNDYRQKRQ